jgi:hypothetical protein
VRPASALQREAACQSSHPAPGPSRKLPPQEGRGFDLILSPHAQAAQRHARQEAVTGFDRTFCRSLGTISFGAHIGHLGFYLVGAPPQKHRLSSRRRRALELLASSPDGATKESLVLVYGIGPDTIAGLVRTRLATARHERVKTDSKTMRVKRYRITNAGRMALEGWPDRLIRPPR